MGFQAFDAQFGGSVPTNPGASQLSSSIFTQPGTSLLQGRDVLVSPQNNFQTTPVRSGFPVSFISKRSKGSSVQQSERSSPKFFWSPSKWYQPSNWGLQPSHWIIMKFVSLLT